MAKIKKPRKQHQIAINFNPEAYPGLLDKVREEARKEITPVSSYIRRVVAIHVGWKPPEEKR